MSGLRSGLGSGVRDRVRVRLGLRLRLGLGFRVKTESPSPLPTPALPILGDITLGILLGGVSPDGVASSWRRIRVVGVTFSAGIVSVVVSVAGIISVAGIVSCTAVVSIVVCLDLDW